MKSSDLFSHPYEPEDVPSTDRDSEPVQSPTFSDAPQRDSSATPRPSS
jgi:hypothetical protein